MIYGSRNEAKTTSIVAINQQISWSHQLLSQKTHSIINMKAYFISTPSWSRWQAKRPSTYQPSPYQQPSKCTSTADNDVRGGTKWIERWNLPWSNEPWTWYPWNSSWSASSWHPYCGDIQNSLYSLRLRRWEILTGWSWPRNPWYRWWALAIKTAIRPQSKTSL